MTSSLEAFPFGWKHHSMAEHSSFSIQDDDPFHKSELPVSSNTRGKKLTPCAAKIRRMSERFQERRTWDFIESKFIQVYQFIPWIWCISCSFHHISSLLVLLSNSSQSAMALVLSCITSCVSTAQSLVEERTSDRKIRWTSIRTIQTFQGAVPRASALGEDHPISPIQNLGRRVGENVRTQSSHWTISTSTYSMSFSTSSITEYRSWHVLDEWQIIPPTCESHHLPPCSSLTAQRSWILKPLGASPHPPYFTGHPSHDVGPKAISLIPANYPRQIQATLVLAQSSAMNFPKFQPLKTMAATGLNRFQMMMRRHKHNSSSMSYQNSVNFCEEWSRVTRTWQDMTTMTLHHKHVSTALKSWLKNVSPSCPGWGGFQDQSRDKPHESLGADAIWTKQRKWKEMLSCRKNCKTKMKKYLLSL